MTNYKAREPFLAILSLFLRILSLNSYRYRKTFRELIKSYYFSEIKRDFDHKFKKKCDITIRNKYHINLKKRLRDFIKRTNGQFRNFRGKYRFESTCDTKFIFENNVFNLNLNQSFTKNNATILIDKKNRIPNA